MPAVQYDTRVKQGETFQRTFTDFGVDLTGASAFMDMRKTKNSPTAISLDQYLAVTPTTVSLSVPANITSGWELVSYYYDLRLRLASGRIVFPLEGRITVEQEVTQR